MFKNYALSFCLFLFAFATVKSQQLLQKTAITPISTLHLAKLNKQKASVIQHFKAAPNAEVFIDEDFEAGDLAGDFTPMQNPLSVGWKVDSAQGNARWDVIDRNNPDNNYFAISNDNKYDDATKLKNLADNDYLLTPAMDFTGKQDVAMLFSYYFEGKFGSTAAVEISTDNGLIWNTLYTLKSDSAWQDDVLIYLTPYVNKTVKIRFVHHDNGNWASGFAIDNLLVKEVEYDAAAGLSLQSDFIFTPLKQTSSIALAGIAANSDVGKITGVSMQVSSAYNNGPLSFLGAGSSTDTLFAQSAIAFPITPALAVSQTGLYLFKGNINIKENDHTSDNDTAYIAVAVTDSTLARDNENIIGEFPLGPDLTDYFGVPASLDLAQVFHLTKKDTLTSVTFATGISAREGDKFTPEIYRVKNGLTDYTQLIRKCETITVQGIAGDNKFYTANVIGQFIPFTTTDTFAVSLKATPLNGKYTTLAITDGLYKVNGSSSRVYLPAFAYDQTSDFNEGLVPIIRANFGEVPTVLNSDLGVSNLNYTNLEFVSMPKSQVKPMSFSADVTNVGPGTATNVKLKVQVIRRTNGAVVYSKTDSLTTLALGASKRFTIGTFTPDTGSYAVLFTSGMNETDSQGANDSLVSVFAVSDSIFSRALLGTASGLAFGNRVNYGAGADLVELGTKFSLNTKDTLSSVNLFISNYKAGDKLYAKVYAATDSTVNLASPLGVSEIQIIGAGIPNQIALFTVPFKGGVILDAGTYFVEMNIIPTDTVNRTAIVSTNGRYKKDASGVVYLGLFYDFSAFGPTLANATLAIEANFGKASSLVGINETDLATSIQLYPNPAKETITLSNVENSHIEIYNLVGALVSKTFSNSHVHSVNTSSLPAGSYVLIITNNKGIVHKNLSISK